MSRSKALITMALIAVLAVGLRLATGPLGITLAGAIGLAVTFGLYWTSLDGELLRQSQSRQPADHPLVTSQPEPDADQPKHWGWRVATGTFAGCLIVLGFALAA